MVRRAVSPWRCLVPFVLAFSGSGSSWGQAAEGTAPPSDCAKSAGLVILVGQEDLYLNREARRASMGGSILKSIVASALTGGSYLVGFYPGYDFGSLIPAPRSLTTGFQPGDVAQALGRELASTRVDEGFELLAPTTRAEDVDEAIWNTPCARVVVINAQYALERTREGVQLSLVAQVLDAPARRTAEQSTVAALEYRSMPMPFESSDDPVALAAGLERILTDLRATLVADFREAEAEMAGMISTKLQPGTSAVSGELLGKARCELFYDDCEKSDRVLAAKPARLWVQPDGEPLVIKSLPLRQNPAP